MSPHSGFSSRKAGQVSLDGYTLLKLVCEVVWNTRLEEMMI
jgi:hypothetical protein